ncbi:hypothetical protein G7B40_027740 [Aetokthonos hydrillicola Thurmond2011]|jgi:hypothetical protein|uniref:Uncharacterized protein n=1 Tax=Aetokthonos hydrillicola Thurmond2011 TaxID=2712845 RepID=A0AAP5MCP4_9CYAN|nr:hypothetical protein [Aetokthonos hydrillicola]MBO3459184.1 hypothetical protein [Aetokthonos hydrillicola CCALA 1050]MBW4584143.1 hypothetical protein [Aetokthonos hydrillicola CCALA 1050]MDR9898324.1 hypothetical protein [Aetokthonos hydrillicola Thurmond2011]
MLQSPPIPNLDTSEIEKAVNYLGIKLSDTELEELRSGNVVSLEGRRLSEIGSVFILAEALCARNSVRNIVFRDIPEVVTEFSQFSGLPIYRWDSDSLGKCCLILTLMDGKPAVRFSHQN